MASKCANQLFPNAESDDVDIHTPHVHFIIFPTYPRWLKASLKNDISVLTLTVVRQVNFRISVNMVAEQIFDVPVPETAEQLVEVPETVSDDRIQQRTAEHIAVIPVPQDVKELVVVLRGFSQDRIQQRTVEQTIPVTLAEKVVEGPVTQTQQGVNTRAQHVVNTVEVERPEIIKQTGQKTHHPGEDRPGDQACRAVHRQGGGHSCRDAETDFHGPDCSDEYRDSTVAGG